VVLILFACFCVLTGRGGQALLVYIAMGINVYFIMLLFDLPPKIRRMQEALEVPPIHITRPYENQKTLLN